MSWNRPLIIIGLIAALSIFLGCAETPVLDRNMGVSYEGQKSSQIVNLEAEENLEPVTGLDGEVAAGILETHENQLKKGAQEREKETPKIFTIGTSGG